MRMRRRDLVLCGRGSLPMLLYAALFVVSLITVTLLFVQFVLNFKIIQDIERSDTRNGLPKSVSPGNSRYPPFTLHTTASSCSSRCALIWQHSELLFLPSGGTPSDPTA